MEYRYAKWDPELLKRLAGARDLMKVFNFLLLQTNGDVEQALRYLEQLKGKGYLPAD